MHANILTCFCQPLKQDWEANLNLIKWIFFYKNKLKNQSYGNADYIIKHQFKFQKEIVRVLMEGLARKDNVWA